MEVNYELIFGLSYPSSLSLTQPFLGVAARNFCWTVIEFTFQEGQKVFSLDIIYRVLENILGSELTKILFLGMSHGQISFEKKRLSFSPLFDLKTRSSHHGFRFFSNVHCSGHIHRNLSVFSQDLLIMDLDSCGRENQMFCHSGSGGGYAQYECHHWF